MGLYQSNRGNIVYEPKPESAIVSTPNADKIKSEIRNIFSASLEEMQKKGYYEEGIMTFITEGAKSQTVSYNPNTKITTTIFDGVEISEQGFLPSDPFWLLDDYINGTNIIEKEGNKYIITSFSNTQNEKIEIISTDGLISNFSIKIIASDIDYTASIEYGI